MEMLTNKAKPIQGSNLGKYLHTGEQCNAIINREKKLMTSIRAWREDGAKRADVIPKPKSNDNKKIDDLSKEDNEYVKFFCAYFEVDKVINVSKIKLISAMRLLS